MFKISRNISIVIIIALIFTSLSCSMVPQVVRNLLASATPTSTNTPIPTATPKPTATATPKPVAPITLEPCLYSEDCAEDVWVGDLLPDGIKNDRVNDLMVPYDQTILVGTTWATRDDSSMTANLEHTQWFFKVDGVDYFEEDWLSYGTTTFEDEPGVDYPAVWLDVSLSDWQIGEPHLIEFGFTLDAPINDGWDDYGTDYSIERRFYIEPTELPTATPKPTATSTPRPAAPAATQANVPSNDNAEVEHRLGTVPVTITNNKSVAVKIVAVGPTTYTVNVPAGQTIKVKWAPGNYSLTAYVGGSYYASTTWNVNENHALFTIN